MVGGRQEMGGAFAQAVDEGGVSLESALLKTVPSQIRAVAWELPHESGVELCLTKGQLGKVRGCRGHCDTGGILQPNIE